jgi:hypothetical protein
MNPEVKEKWIKALRSGEYQQGRHGLRREDSTGNVSYCCLGVLCELYRVEKKRSTWTFIEHIWFSFMNEGSILPEKVMKWAGMDDPSGMFRRKTGPEDSLTSVNDSGKSFKQIARIIEKYF